MYRLRIYSIEISLIALLAISVAFFGYLGYGLLPTDPSKEKFSGQRAMGNVTQQLAFGNRTVGSEASQEMSDWLVSELSHMGWDIVIQPFMVPNEGPGEVMARNIIAIKSDGETRSRRGVDEDNDDEIEDVAPIALLSTHYDTRLFADADPDIENNEKPVPGANDGASGTAVLLELARTLDVASSGHTICLVFFDASDNGEIGDWEWILGSRYFVEHLQTEGKLVRCSQPSFVVNMDLVGDIEQQFYFERNSTASLNQAIWEVAEILEYNEWFISQPKWALVDDHSPFLGEGIPAIDIIDFDYPHWHTVRDTIDKLGEESLERVGRTLEYWLEHGANF